MFKFIKNIGFSLMATLLVVPAVAMAQSSTYVSLTEYPVETRVEPGDQNVSVLEFTVEPTNPSYVGALEVQEVTIKCDGANTFNAVSIYNDNKEIGFTRFNGEWAHIDFDDELVVSTGAEDFEVKVDIGVKEVNYKATCSVENIQIERLITQAIVGQSLIDFNTVNGDNEVHVDGKKPFGPDDIRDIYFHDVHTWTHYYNSIYWMADNGIVSGYSDGYFRPNACVNRAEFLKMLMLSSGQRASYYGSNQAWFWDVPYNAWYNQYLDVAVAKGIIQGYPDGSFGPQNCVNRAEAIKMASIEMFGSNVGIYPTFRNYQKPVDVEENAWYSRYVNFALNANAVGREHTFVYADGLHYEPAGAMTRKEVAEMLYRMRVMRDNNLAFYDGIKYIPFI